MSEPLGTEFIRILPDLTGFRAAIQEQVTAALAGVQSQVRAQAAGLAAAVTPPTTRVTRETQQAARPSVTQAAAASVAPQAAVSSRRVIAETGAAATAQTKLAGATRATNEQLKVLSTTNRTVSGSTQRLRHDIEDAETSIGRFTRGTAAATAASTGFFRAVSFASGAFLVGATLGATIGAAVSEFRNATTIGAQTAAIIRATGEAANVTAKQVDTLAKSILNLTGIDDEQVKSAANILLTFRLIRNEVGAGNDIFTRAVKAVTDISSVFKTDLRGSAVQLGKALQDPIRGVIALRRSGITLSQSQRDLIKNLVETGRLLEAQRVILGEVDKQVGGTAEAIGRTLPGRLDILKERARNALGEYVKRISESTQATKLAQEAVQGLGQAFAVAKGIIETLGPPLLTLVSALSKATQAVGGVGALLAAVAAYKAVKLAIAAATVAQGLYTRSVLVGVGAITAEEGALLASAGAFKGQSAAALLGRTVQVGSRAVQVGEQAAPLIGNAALIERLRQIDRASAGATKSVGGLGKATGALGGVLGLLGLRGGLAAERGLAGVGTAGVAAGEGLGAAAAGTGALSTGLAAIGGPLGIAAIGAGALGLAFVKLREDAQGAAGTLKGFKNALRDASEAFDRVQKIRQDLAAQRGKISIATFDVAAARRAAEQARAAQAASRAPAGSLEQLALAERVRQADRALVAAENALFRAQSAEKNKLRELNDEQRKRPSIIAKETAATLKQIRALSQVASAQAQVKLIDPLLNPAARAARNQRDSEQQIQRLRSLLDKASQSGDHLQRTVAKALDAVVTSLNRIVTPREVTIAVRLALRGQTPGQIVADLLKTGNQTIGGLTPGGAARRAFELQGQAQPSLLQEEAIAKRLLRVESQRLSKLKEILQTRRQDQEIAHSALQTAQENVQAARDQAAAARQNLSDTIQQAREGVNQAVRDAKTNLDSLGQAIADALGQFADKAGATLGTGGTLGKKFRELRDQILAGQGGVETQKAAQRISTILQGQQGTAADTTDKIKQRFADLADSFSRGNITTKQFNAQLRNLLKGVDLGAFRRQFGSAATNQLRAEITAFRQQARLIAGGPRRPGGTFEATLVRPLEAVAEGNKQIAAAQKDVTRADRDLGRALRELRNAQIRETRANTKAVQALTKELQQERKVREARARLNRPPKKGKAGQESTQGTTVGAGAP